MPDCACPGTTHRRLPLPRLYDLALVTNTLENLSHDQGELILGQLRNMGATRIAVLAGDASPWGFKGLHWHGIHPPLPLFGTGVRNPVCVRFGYLQLRAGMETIRTIGPTRKCGTKPGGEMGGTGSSSWAGESFPGIAMNPSMDAALSPSLAKELPGKDSPAQLLLPYRLRVSRRNHGRNLRSRHRRRPGPGCQLS